MEAEDHRKKKYEQKHMRYDDERLKGLENYEVLVISVLVFGMDHINNLKFKDIIVFIYYHFGSKNLKESLNKVELMEDLKDFLENIGAALYKDGMVGCLL